MKNIIIIVLVIALIIGWIILDRKNRANLAEAEREALKRLGDAEGRYTSEAARADGFALEVQRLLNLPEKIIVKTVTRTITETIPGGPDVEIIISPREAFPGLASAIDKLIASHYVLRAEHDNMIGALRDTLKIKDLQLRKAKWGWTVGFQGGVSFTGAPYVGFGACWGKRL